MVVVVVVVVVVGSVISIGLVVEIVVVDFLITETLTCPASFAFVSCNDVFVIRKEVILDDGGFSCRPDYFNTLNIFICPQAKMR